MNPNCKDFFAITRKYFPNSSILLVTNGVLLPKQNEEFWKSAHDNVIEIRPTKYPIKVDWESIQQTCKEYNVAFQFFMNTGKKTRAITKMALNLKGDSDPFNSFIGCTLSQCAQLHNGKIFPCTFTAYIQHFNKKFHQNLQITPLDCLDIHDSKTTYQDILFLMSKPLPFCRYCKTLEWQHIGGWETSKKNISEYL